MVVSIINELVEFSNLLIHLSFNRLQLQMWVHILGSLVVCKHFKNMHMIK